MKTTLLALCSAAAVLAQPPQHDYPPAPGNLTVSNDKFYLGGMKCGKQEGDVKIYYPSELKGSYPIIAYGHGFGGEIIDNLCEDVASLGMIVMAPMTSGGACDESDDLLHALKGSKGNTALHKALKYADFSRSGVMGHSMGAYSAVQAVSKADASYNLKAVMVSHEGARPGETTVNMPKDVPAMFTSGGKDGYNSRGSVKALYDAAPSRPKVWASYKDGEHMEPLLGGHLNPFDAHFLACYLLPLESSCDFIYGKGKDTLCEKNTMDGCEYVTK